ncbi:peptide deformylase [Streptomyces sp. NPDC048644]|uniref:peptide deformylase n=1 Tax=Streptomyces sp. NPDC048644 TaxID=3365582 RepID=UPI00371A7A81
MNTYSAARRASRLVVTHEPTGALRHGRGQHKHRTHSSSVTKPSVVDELFAAMERIGQVHPFAKGMGIAAPQIGIARAAAVVQPPGDAPPSSCSTRNHHPLQRGGRAIRGLPELLDVRGLVPRPLRIMVETTALTGETVTTVYDRGLARPIHHEIDHLDGLLYTARMRTGADPIPVEKYRQTGRDWVHDGA